MTTSPVPPQRASTQDRVSRVFAEVIGVEPPRGAQTTPDDLDGQWDSLGQVILIHEMEARFGVTLPEELLIERVPLGKITAAVRAALGE